MTRSILLAGAALISVSISPLNAEASEALWCAVISRSDGDVHWDCTYRSIEECRPNVIANNGKRGFCSPSPSYVANRTELKNSRQAARTGSKTIAKSEKSIAVKKESPRHRNANAHTKIAESTITTKIETPQHSQSDGKSNAELRNSIATKIEIPQPSQSDDKSNAEANMKSIAAKTGFAILSIR